jgi:hypothetical protein
MEKILWIKKVLKYRTRLYKQELRLRAELEVVSHQECAKTMSPACCHGGNTNAWRERV